MHDYLYIAWQVMDNSEAESSYRDFADDLMYHAMWKAGMRCRAHVLYCVVRLLGRTTFEKKNCGALVLCDTALNAVRRNEKITCPKYPGEGPGKPRPDVINRK